MVSQFRLLELPSLALKQVFLQFRAVDIFELSFTSSRVRNIIISARLRAIEHNVIFVKEYPYIVTVLKRNEEVDEDIFTWKFIGNEKCHSNKTEKKIGCHRFDKCYKQESTIFCCFHNSEFGLSVIFDYIFKIFRGPVNLDLSLNEIRNIHALLLNQNLSRCQTIILDVDFKRNDKTIYEDTAEILDLVTIGKALKTEVHQNDELDIEKIRNLESVHIIDAHWMSFSTLLSFNCRFGAFVDHKFGPVEITKFVENWYNSTDKTLVRMRFGWDDRDPFKITESKLKWEEWDPKRRSRWFFDPSESFCFNRIDCCEGHDVTRPDGLTATILYDEGFVSNVIFLVWHDRFPKEARLKTLNRQTAYTDVEINKLESTIPLEPDVEFYTLLAEKSDGFYDRLIERKAKATAEIKFWQEAEEGGCSSYP